MRIGGRTVVCGIIGDPVEHSISPAMQNAAFRACKVDYVYVPFRVPRGSAEAAALAMRNIGIRGLNVTVPHKVDIVTYLDEVDPLAVRVGAVNTVVNDSGKLRGYNTDAAGFMRGLQGAGVQVSGARVVVLGAGGASRAIVLALVDAGASVVIVNRNADRAASLAVDVESETGLPVGHSGLTEENLCVELPRASLLVNTTTVGMYPSIGTSLVAAGHMRPGLTVCDIVYNPRETMLLRQAREGGAIAVEGVEMLIGQGALAFELWTGVPAPVDVMRAAVYEELAGAAH